MAEGKKYIAQTPIEIPGKNGEKPKTFFVNLGTAFVTKNGNIMVYLNALPVNGKIIISEKKEFTGNRGGGGYSSKGGYGNNNGPDNADEAPF